MTTRAEHLAAVKLHALALLEPQIRRVSRRRSRLEPASRQTIIEALMLLESDLGAHDETRDMLAEASTQQRILEIAEKGNVEDARRFIESLD